MSNKPNQINVKVCNHKPGDIWDDPNDPGCCGGDTAKNQSSETISNTGSAVSPSSGVQKNQISNEQNNASINPQK